MKYLKNTVRILPLLVIIFASIKSHAIDRRGRLGAGMSNQFINGIPAVSFKLQKSRAFTIGAMFAFEADDTDGGHGLGVKLYRNIFEEPQLNFYGSALVGMVSDKVNSKKDSGFQVDLTLGSEFSLQGLESIGFSFEFGVSLNKLYNDEFVVETAGYHIITAGVHFYL